MIMLAAIKANNVVGDSVDDGLSESVAAGDGDVGLLDVGVGLAEGVVEGEGIVDALVVGEDDGDGEILAVGEALGERLGVGEGEGEAEGVGDIEGVGEGVSGVGLNAKAFDSAVKLHLSTFATCWV